MYVRKSQMKLKRKVLVILDGLPSEENPNCWKHALDQIISLSEKCDVTIASPVYWTVSLRHLRENRKRLQELPRRNYKINTIPCWRPRYIDPSFIPWKYRKHYIQIITMIFSLLFLVVAKRMYFDIIHAHFVYRPGYIATVLGRILGKPVVITAAGSDIHQNLYKEDRLFRKRTIDAMRWCSKIIALSEFLKKVIDKNGFAKKTCIIPYGFSERELYPMNKDECRIKLYFKKNKKILLFVGNLVPVKGVDILIEAFKQVRHKESDVELFIIGDGPEKNILEQKANKYKIDKVIHFLGSREHKVIPLYINSADVIVQPSRNEGRGVVILEALACGKPVVASRVGGIPETIVSDKLGILVEKENPEALAKGILKALSRSWDRAYQKNFVKQFTNDRLTEKITKVYDDVLDRM